MEFKFKAVLGMDGRKHFSNIDSNVCFCGEEIARFNLRDSRSITTCCICDNLKCEFEELNKSFEELNK